MSGLEEIGGVLLSQASKRAEAGAYNMSNVTTAGFKAIHHLSRFEGRIDNILYLEDDTQSVDFTVGKQQKTGNSLDFALQGEGFFILDTKNGFAYTRNGQFRRDVEGLLVSDDGVPVQGEGGSIKLGNGRIAVTSDGMLLEDGRPVDRLRVVTFDAARMTPSGASRFTAADTGRSVESPGILQGMIETSNVSTGTEMVNLMAAMRQAEMGQRVVQTWDDLMGRVITVIGGN